MRVTLWLDGRHPWPDLLELACRAEIGGWDALRIGDPPHGTGRALECWTAIGALAEQVPRVRLDAVVRDEAGRGRHPAVVAKLASTVDQLSGGRLLLGLAPAAGPEDGPRLSEAIDVVRSLTSNDRTTFRGTFYQLQDAPLDPKPIQQPFPILLIGGSAALAAAKADHWTITGSPEEIDAELDALEASCRQAGRDRGTITVSALGDERPRQSGLDEWVVPQSALGDDRSAWPGAVARIHSLAERRLN
jgi:alkanesulfonate monooxygenase SsuD/methylene tetrahydromethanopterin reductase-like flavin-dependent oxidoreductase (luciferase family)